MLYTLSYHFNLPTLLSARNTGYYPLLSSTIQTIKLLNPVKHLKTKKIFFTVQTTDIWVNIRPSLNYGHWIFKPAAIYKTLACHFPDKKAAELNALTRELSLRTSRIVRRKAANKTLAIIPLVPWVTQKLLQKGELFVVGVRCFTESLTPTSASKSSPASGCWQVLYFNARSLSRSKALAMKALMHTFLTYPDIVCTAETRTDAGLSVFQKFHIITHNIPERNRAEAAVIMDKCLHVVKQNLNIDDAIIQVLEKSGNLLIQATLYLSNRLPNKKHRLRLIFQEIHNLALCYQKPSILITGDFNLPKDSILDVFEEMEYIQGSESSGFFRIVRILRILSGFAPDFRISGFFKFSP